MSIPFLGGLHLRPGVMGLSVLLDEVLLDPQNKARTLHDLSLLNVRMSGSTLRTLLAVAVGKQRQIRFVSFGHGGTAICLHLALDTRGNLGYKTLVYLSIQVLCYNRIAGSLDMVPAIGE